MSHNGGLVLELRLGLPLDPDGVNRMLKRKAGNYSGDAYCRATSYKLDSLVLNDVLFHLPDLLAARTLRMGAELLHLI